MHKLKQWRGWVKAAVGVVSALSAASVEAVSVERLWSQSYGFFQISVGKSGAVYGYADGIYRLNLKTGERNQISTRTEVDPQIRTMLVKEGLHPHLQQGSFAIGKPELALGRPFNLIWDTDRRRLAIVPVPNSSRCYLQEFAPHSSTLLAEARLAQANFDYLQIVGNPDKGNFALYGIRYGMTFLLHYAAFFGPKLRQHYPPILYVYGFDDRGILGAPELPGSRNFQGSDNGPGALTLFDPVRNRTVWSRNDLNFALSVGSFIVAQPTQGHWQVINPKNGKTLASMPEPFQRVSQRYWVFGDVIIGEWRDRRGVNHQIAYQIH